LNDSTYIYIESPDDEAESGEQLVSKRGEKPVVEAESRFTEAINNIKPAAQAVLDAFIELNRPKEIQLEFGLKFNAKAGAIIASVDSEASFKVSLKWENQD
jgi:hypothetical protein